MNEILTKKEHLFLKDTGILHVVALDGAYLEYEDGLEIIEAVAQIAQAKRLPVMVDIRKAKGASHACRKLFQGEELAKYQSAAALIVDSPISYLVGNFFIGLNKTPFPLQIFTNEDKALDWLQTYA